MVAGVVFTLILTSLFPFRGLDTLRVVSDFGEARILRFHMGWDLSIHGRAGYPLIANQRLEVYRVRSNHWGYGRALYLRDERGFLWVFAHLDRLHPRLEERLREAQLAQHSSTIRLNLEPPEVFMPGDTVALAGYSGNVDPHIHMEVRDSLERPIHPTYATAYPRPSRRGRLEHLAFRAVPLSPESRINGLPLPARWFGIPETLYLEGPVGLEWLGNVILPPYPTKPREIRVYWKDTLWVHLRYDSLDYADYREARDLYRPNENTGDRWIRFWGYRYPALHAVKTYRGTMTFTEDGLLRFVFWHPATGTLQTRIVVRINHDLRPRAFRTVAWDDTLQGLRWAQTFDRVWVWGTHPVPGFQVFLQTPEGILQYRTTPLVMLASRETLRILHVRPEDRLLTLGQGIRLRIPEGAVRHPFWVVMRGHRILPHVWPLDLPLTVQPPDSLHQVYVLDRRGRKAFVPRIFPRVGQAFFVDRDSMPPVLLSCTRLPDRIRVKVKDDLSGWWPDRSAGYIQGNWAPFVGHFRRGWMEFYGTYPPKREVRLHLEDRAGNTTDTLCLAR